MKSFYAILFVCLAFLISLSSCTPKAENAIIGMWQDSSGSTLEFLKNGTIIVNAQRAGNYAFIDSSRIRFGDSKIATIKINGDDMELTSPNVQSSHLKRIKLPARPRIDKRVQATEILNDARIIESAMDDYAIENDKKAGDSVRSTDIAKFFKPGSRLHTQAVSGEVLSDMLGNKFIYSTFDSGVHANPASKAYFKDVIENEASFWGSY